ncbi:hypothetical protein IFR05_008532 [Cadophora sp. M221]|nr:hypothetical protein IFR05_008532 [Cadophora sp. M221]
MVGMDEGGVGDEAEDTTDTMTQQNAETDWAELGSAGGPDSKLNSPLFETRRSNNPAQDDDSADR